MLAVGGLDIRTRSWLAICPIQAVCRKLFASPIGRPINLQFE